MALAPACSTPFSALPFGHMDGQTLLCPLSITRKESGEPSIRNQDRRFIQIPLKLTDVNVRVGELRLPVRVGEEVGVEGAIWSSFWSVKCQMLRTLLYVFRQICAVDLHVHTLCCGRVHACSLLAQSVPPRPAAADKLRIFLMD